MRRRGLPSFAQGREGARYCVYILRGCIVVVVVTLSTQAALSREKYKDVAARYSVVEKGQTG